MYLVSLYPVSPFLKEFETLCELSLQIDPDRERYSKRVDLEPGKGIWSVIISCSSLQPRQPPSASCKQAGLLLAVALTGQVHSFLLRKKSMDSPPLSLFWDKVMEWNAKATFKHIQAIFIRRRTAAVGPTACSSSSYQYLTEGIYYIWEKLHVHIICYMSINRNLRKQLCPNEYQIRLLQEWSDKGTEIQLSYTQYELYGTLWIFN